ncbi:GIY-YIG nuclease family protein [Streptomyces cacaoi]|uniref:Bacteriophage T5 Orf172 DNA-binding domain-containing protein n=1 Tax=Streptomyces cacaoi TaxID=1898 RepID=A0A4Y3R7X8_STRCI|nr:GIY-YIG nuclease family protein [Streptomyces cacaoi]NNG84590.1 GIY-YIG nuclease family protein [Streptomyces cacaoi]GEB51950.1 hypothetical protein SCA03_45010 [Streptomyces cacaoi]
MTVDDANKAGYIYILVNSSLPNLVKIGLTRGPTKRRAADLSRSSGIPTPFVIAYDELVADCATVEKWLHEKFAAFRENERREFFRITPKEAIDGLQKAARFSPFIDDEDMVRIDVLPIFDARCRRWLRKDLVGLSYLQTRTLCALEMATQEDFRESDFKVVRENLDFISDSRDLLFRPEVEPEENARRLVAMDSYSLIMCFDFIDREVGIWLNEQSDGDVPFSARAFDSTWQIQQ